MDKKKVFKALFILILIGFLLYKTIGYFGAIGYRETWTICIDYFHEGKLWTGQPHCEGALLPFYILSILDTIVGREYVQIAAIVFSTIISGIFFWVFMKVVKKELNEEDFFWPGLFFGLFFYINTITNIEAVMNSFFFFIAYYFLLYSEYKHKEYLTGVFFLCALLSKINVILQIAFLLFWYSYEKRVWYFEEKKLRISFKKEILILYGKIFASIIIGFIVFTTIYKYFWIYSWKIFTNLNIASSVFQTAKNMIFVNIAETEIIIYITLLIVAGISTYLFIKEKKSYALLSGPVFLIGIFMLIRSFGMLMVNGAKYWSVIFPFAILSLLKVKQLWQTPIKKQAIQGILLLLVLYPGLYYGPFLFRDDLSYIDSMNVIDANIEAWQEKDTLIKQIHYGYTIVPEQEGRILMENDPAVFRRSIISFGSNIPYDQIDFLTRKYMESHPDVWGFPRYQELLGENLIYNPTTSELNEKEQEVISKIKNGTYSLIIFGPPEWAISERILANIDNETMQSYCQIAVPNNVWMTEEGWHFSYFFFKNPNDCQIMIQNMYTYYTQEYQDICRKDKTTANMITTVLRQNGAPFDLACKEGGESLEFLKKGYQSKKIEIILMLLLFTVPFLMLIPKYQQLDKQQKKIYLIILGILAIAIMYIYVTIDPTPFHNAIVQKITTGGQ